MENNNKEISIKSEKAQFVNKSLKRTPEFFIFTTAPWLNNGNTCVMDGFKSREEAIYALITYSQSLPANKKAFFRLSDTNEIDLKVMSTQPQFMIEAIYGILELPLRNDATEEEKQNYYKSL